MGEKTKVFFPCSDDKCKGKVPFEGHVDRNKQGYRLVLMTERGHCHLCGKKTGVEVYHSGNFLGFSLSASKKD